MKDEKQTSNPAEKDKSEEAPIDLATRTRQFALRIIRLYEALPKGAVAYTIGKQILRSGTSVGANYREASRSRSKAEFTAKIDISLMELEETRYWLELLGEAGTMKPASLRSLYDEAGELIAILVSISRKTKGRS